MHNSGTDICQGRVGDCWFLAALFVIAEREDLIGKVVETINFQRNGGPYSLWLFIDCCWRNIIVDDSLPCVKDKKGNVVLAFSKARDHCLWIPLLEKAYAKAHGSYKAISGGWIDEAMFDLTSFPTQSIHLSGFGFDVDTVWQQLLSYAQSKFPMGCSCMNPGKGSGLVGHHAYSIVQVQECNNPVLGQQSTLHSYFGKPKPKPQPVLTEAEQIERAVQLSLNPSMPTNQPKKPLRMLRIRNPWGKGEWKGAFSGKSDKWSSKLRKELKNVTRVNDGTFWIEYSDFLAQYANGTIDVCMAHKDWFSSTTHLTVPLTAWTADHFIEIKTIANTWTYFSIVQPTKRGKADGKYYYSDISFVVVKLVAGSLHSFTIVHLKLAGKCKVYHSDIILDKCNENESFILVPFITSCNTKRTLAPFTVRLFSAEPLQTRKVAPDTSFALRAIHLSLNELHDKSLLKKRVALQGGSSLVVVESRSSCIALVSNISPTHDLNCSFLLHGPGVGASNIGPNQEYPLYIVAPRSQRIVSVVSTSVHGFDVNKEDKTGVFVLSKVQSYLSVPGRRREESGICTNRGIETNSECIEIESS